MPSDNLDLEEPMAILKHAVRTGVFTKEGQLLTLA